LNNNRGNKIIRTLSRWPQASALFLIILLGWLGDSLISMLIGRPRLSFHDVYRSWKLHWHRHPQTEGAGPPSFRQNAPAANRQKAAASRS
jgi:predicted alpha/beta hydrolase